MKTIAIIGAGAAGLMTAATLLEGELSDIHIHLFEKNTSPGKKVIISGGGRCNVTTGITDMDVIAKKYTRGWSFISRAFRRFSPTLCRAWFESRGVPLYIQEDMRVFPVSDDGRDVVSVFEQIFAKYRDKITLHYGEGISEIGSSGNEISDSKGDRGEKIDEVKDDTRKKYHLTTPKGEYEVDILVIATGGNAYSHTGSSGDGYAFARALGHTVTELGPSLSSFLTGETWLHALSGLAFEEAKIGELTSPLLLTHFGISGPLAFMVSSLLAWEKIDPSSPRVIAFSPIASMDEKSWDTYLKSEFALHPKKYLSSILGELLPRRFADAFVNEYLPDRETTFVGSISRKDREKIAKLLGGGIPLSLLERRPGDEFVTAGGVSTDEIDPETMESKIQKHLYFAGEVLNVDGYTGGFSLQICWASGYVVGLGISTRLI